MNYLFLSNNYRDYFHFKSILEKSDEFIPITMLFPHEKKSKTLNKEIVIRLENGDKLADYAFILEYSLRIYPKKQVVNSILPLVSSLYRSLNNILKEGDSVLTWNSGEWASRAIYELCQAKKAKCVFMESYIFKGSYQMSTLPLTNSKYGTPEINGLSNKGYNDIDVAFYNDFLKYKESKYDQEDTSIKIDPFDVFFVGQVPNDVNVVLLGDKAKTTEQICYKIASQEAAKSFIYKIHPETLHRGKYIKNKCLEEVERLKTLPNVRVIDTSIHRLIDNCKELYVYSSTVGLEAQFYNKRVRWLSDTNYKGINLTDLIGRYKFINGSRHIMCYSHNIYTKLKSIIDNTDFSETKYMAGNTSMMLQIQNS